MTDEELTWFRAHPEPQSSTTGSSKVSLWNYPIGQSALVPQHVTALRRFVGLRADLGPASSTADFSILGHASASGEASGNKQLAIARAENVHRYLIGLGFRQKSIAADGAGSGSPADSARTGQAYARNRRVDVTIHEAAPFGEDSVKPAPGRTTPTDSSPATALPVVPFTQFAFSFKLPTFLTPNLIIEETLEISGKMKVAGGVKKALEVGVVFQNLKPSVKFEKKVFEDLAVKVGITPPTGDKLTTVSIGLKDKFISIPLEIGIQSPSNLLKPTVVYFNVSLPKFAPVEIDFYGTSVLVDIDVFKIKIAVGPSPALLLRLANFAVPASSTIVAVATAPAAVTLAAAGGAFVVAGAILYSVTYFTAEAKREGLAFAHRLAARDGAASRAATETLGSTASLTGYAERRLEWTKMGGFEANAEFTKGATAVDEVLRELLTAASDGRVVKRAAWVENYAKGAGALDFTLVRERMFLHLGAYDRAETDLHAAVSSL